IHTKPELGFVLTFVITGEGIFQYQTMFRVIDRRLERLDKLNPVMKTKTTRRPIKSRVPSRSKTSKKLVRIAGLEPARLAALPPQSSVSANSTISATRHKLKHQKPRTQADFGSSDLVRIAQGPPRLPENLSPNSLSNHCINSRWPC